MGAIEHTLTRDQGWLFLKLGESLERVYRTALILRAKLPGALAAAEPRGRRRRSTTRVAHAPAGAVARWRTTGARTAPGWSRELVVPFLLLDPHSPRSLRYGLDAVKDQLERIAGGGEPTAAVRLIGRLARRSRLSGPAGSRGAGPTPPSSSACVDIMGQTHDALSTQYFVT